MVPAMMITSACLGVALATSKPNRDQSYFAAAVDIISMAQQDVPNTNGQSELDRAQLITSSSFVTRIPPPAVGCTSPGNDLPATSAVALSVIFCLSPIFCPLTSISTPPFYAHTGTP